MAQLRESMASNCGAQYQFSRPSLFTFSNPLEVEIAGYDLERLRKVADAIKARMIANGRFADIQVDDRGGNPEIQIVFDQERAAQLGLQVRDVADRVVASVRGELATRYKWRDKKIDVLVRSVDTRSASLEEVRNLIVNPGSDRPVPLVAVADVKLATGPAEIRRSSQERVAIISADLAYGGPRRRQGDLRKIVDSIEIPGVLRRAWPARGGIREAKTSLIFAFSLAIFLVYLVMASQFRIAPAPVRHHVHDPARGDRGHLGAFHHRHDSQRHRGSRHHHAGRHRDNNAIVLLDAVNQARARGMDKITALVVAGRTRLRPILITKLTGPSSDSCDGAWPRRRRRDPGADGHYGHWRSYDRDVPDADRDSCRLCIA